MYHSDLSQVCSHLVSGGFSDWCRELIIAQTKCRVDKISPRAFDGRISELVLNVPSVKLEINEFVDAYVTEIEIQNKLTIWLKGVVYKLAVAVISV